jgi:hypothetical protein
VMSGCGAVIVAGELPATPTSLVSFDPNAQGITPRTVIPTATTFTLAGLAWANGSLVVGDQGTAGGTPGIRVFDANTSSGCSLTERAAEIALPLAPVGFAALR